MRKVSSIIQLTRGEQAFAACLALVNGAFEELSGHLEMLHPEEKAVFQSYEYELRKKSYLLGRLSAKVAVMGYASLKEAESVWIDSGVFNFPVVKCPFVSNVQVGITHSNDIGLSIAFPEVHPVGVDLEEINKEREDVVLSQLTNAETGQLRHLFKNDVEAYTLLFSMKESLSKILKTGMMLNFKFLEMKDLQWEDGVMKAAFKNFGQYKAYGFIAGVYALTIVLPARTTPDFSEMHKILEAIS